MTTENISILFVIVLYKQRLNESLAYQCVKKQLEEGKHIDLQIYVHDNSCEEYCYANLPEYVHYYNDMKNSGLSRAYNNAAKYAFDNGLNWMILLDQDTYLPEDFVKNYVKTIRNYPAIQLFSSLVEIGNKEIYLSPAKYGIKKINPTYKSYIGIQSLYNVGVINSGLCVNIGLFIRAKGYDENVYLDFSDFRFIEKVRVIHPNIFIVNQILIQDFSGTEKNKIKQLARFGIYCDCAKSYPKRNYKDIIEFMTLVLGRSILLAYRFRSLKFIRIFIDKYLK